MEEAFRADDPRMIFLGVPDTVVTLDPSSPAVSVASPQAAARRSAAAAVRASVCRFMPLRR
jgi:hypothetical protein